MHVTEDIMGKDGVRFPCSNTPQYLSIVSIHTEQSLLNCIPQTKFHILGNGLFNLRALHDSAVYGLKTSVMETVMVASFGELNEKTKRKHANRRIRKASKKVCEK